VRSFFLWHRRLGFARRPSLVPFFAMKVEWGGNGDGMWSGVELELEGMGREWGREWGRNGEGMWKVFDCEPYYTSDIARL
jgi:hypothetical protein